MPHIYRRTKGTIGELETDQKSGGLTGDQVVTTINEDRPVGNILVWDANGNAVNSGIPLVSLAALLDVLVDDGGAPILTSGGEVINLS